AADKLLRGRKLRVDTTVVEADIDYPTDADLLEQAVRKLGGLVRRVKARGAASRTRVRDRGRAAGRGGKEVGRAGTARWGCQPDPVPRSRPRGWAADEAVGPDAAAAEWGGDGGGGSAHRPGRGDRAAHLAAGAGGGAQRPWWPGSPTWRW